LYALGDGYVTCGTDPNQLNTYCGQRSTSGGNGIGIYYYACDCVVYYVHAVNVLEVDAEVKAGDVVGYSGASSDGYEHLHLEIRNLANTRVYNPLYFFEPTAWNSINPYYMAYHNNYPSPQTRMYEVAMSTGFNYWKWNGSYPLAVVR
jgi:murein DD-endopeptidase MepM/ murein hydrolase activator NlpD